MLTVALLVLTPGGAEASRQHWDYIVVGAGPGGLQMGHFLEKAGRNYTLIDRGSVPGQWRPNDNQTASIKVIIQNSQ